MIKEFKLVTLEHNSSRCKCFKVDQIKVKGKKSKVTYGDKEGISQEQLEELLHNHPKPGNSKPNAEVAKESKSLIPASCKGASKPIEAEEKDKGDRWYNSYKPIQIIQGGYLDKYKMGLDFDLLSKKAGQPVNCRCTAGNCLSESRIKQHYNDEKEIDQAAKALLLLIERECGNGIYDSPRYDSEKLIKAISTKSLTSISRLKKEEMHRKRLLVFCDISGSCSEVCNELAATCYRLIEFDDRICIMFISDDGPYLIVGDGVDDHVTAIMEKMNRFINSDFDKTKGSHERYTERHYPYIKELYQDLINYLSVKAAIGFSDDQAQQTFRAVTECGIDMFYLANTNVSGIREAQNKSLNEEEQEDATRYALKQYLGNWKRLPKMFADGVGSISAIQDAVLDYLTYGTGKIVND